MLKSLRKGRDVARGAVVRRLAAFLADRRGNVAVLTALMLIPIVGALSLGGELGVWFFMNRSMQNAADSSAIAAATTGSTTTTVYQPEASAWPSSTATRAGSAVSR